MERKSKMIKPIDRAKLDAFLACDTTGMGSLVLLLTWDAGLSAAEIATLRWDDVDTDAGVIRVNDRTIPMSERLRTRLNTRHRSGPYILTQKPTRIATPPRMRIFRRAREALNAAGMQEINLSDVQHDFTLRTLEEKSMLDASRGSGPEAAGPQEPGKRTDNAAPARRRTSGVWDKVDLEAALGQEGDSLDSRIIWLSWQGNLLVKEMAAMRWSDVDLKNRTWSVGAERKPIPSDLADKMSGWNRQEKDELILKGARSDKPLAISYINRRSGEFLVRYGLEHVLVSSIRGKWSQISQKDAEKIVLRKLTSSDALTIGALCRDCGVDAASMRQILQRMNDDGKINFNRRTGICRTKGILSPEEKIEKLIAAHRETGEPLRLWEIRTETGMSESQISYYINKGMEAGLLVRQKQGVYSVK